jgi:hypothetical protein
MTRFATLMSSAMAAIVRRSSHASAEARLRRCLAAARLAALKKSGAGTAPPSYPS